MINYFGIDEETLKRERRKHLLNIAAEVLGGITLFFAFLSISYVVTACFG